MAKNIKEREIEWVDVHDDALMVKLGIRNPDLQPRDPSVWTKTPKEKKILKKLRNTHKRNTLGAKRSNNNHGVLLVYIKPDIKNALKVFNGIPNKGTIKTTFSFVCNRYNINDILENMKKKYSVVKYRWNGNDYICR